MTNSLKKKATILFLLSLFLFVSVFIVGTTERVSATEIVTETLSEFSQSDITVSSASSMPESYTEWKGMNLSEFFGGSYYYPDIMALSLKTDVEGSTDGKALKVGFVDFAYTPAIGFKILFPKTIKYAETGKITLRVYMHIDTTGRTEIKLYSLSGESYFSFTTAVQDEWIDIEILNDDLSMVMADGECGGFNVFVKFSGIRSGNYQDLYSDYWKQTFKADPSYMYFDSITYSSLSDIHTVTFDSNYGISGIGNTDVTVRSAKVAEPVAPYALGYEFGGWYKDENFTNLFDFSSEITSDITLHAKWTSVTVPDGTISDFRSSTAQIGYAHISSESYVEWYNYPISEKMSGGDSRFPASGTEFVTDLSGSEDGNALKLNFVGLSFTTAVGFKVKFPATLKTDEIGKITLRVFMHIDTDGCSVIKVYSSDGASHYDFTTETSDEWIDVEIKGDDLKKIATEDNFSELVFVIVFGEVRNGNYEDLYSVYWGREFKGDPSYMYIDTISYSGLQDVTLEIDGKTETIQTIDGEPLKVESIPYKEGYMFTGWTMNGEPYDASLPITAPISLKAEFSEEAESYAAYYGVYENGSLRIILNEDKTAFIIDGLSYTEYIYQISKSGVIALNKDGQFLFDEIEDGAVVHGGINYTSAEKIKVVYSQLGKEREIFIKSGDEALNLKLKIAHYLFGGWKTEGSEDYYEFNAAATDGLKLIADLKMNEIDDYTDYLGSFYLASADMLFVLKGNNQGEIVKGNVKTDIQYYYFKDGEGLYIADGKEYVIYDFSPSNFKIEQGRCRLLKRYIVTFINGDDRQNITVDSGYYKVEKPADPVKEGFTFEGWVAEGNTELYDFDQVVNASVTLNAKWTQIGANSEQSSGTSGKKGCRNEMDGITFAVTITLLLSVVLCKKRSVNKIK